MAYAGVSAKQREMAKPIFLVVDGSANVRDGIAQELCGEFANCRVMTAATGEEAVKTVGPGSVSAVIIDIDLPGMSGIEATRRIRAASPRTPVVVLSIHEEKEYERDALAAGATLYVGKRHLRRDLLSALRTACASGAATEPPERHDERLDGDGLATSRGAATKSPPRR